MKKKFSKKWRASKQPRKQRKYSYNAPLHLRHKQMSSQLSKELRKKYEKRNIEVRKGDEVKIMKGKHRKKQGKVAGVDLKKEKISIDGIQVTRKDGTKVNIWFDPSNVLIMGLNTDDKKRMKRINKTEEEKKQDKTQKPNKETKGKTKKAEEKNALKKN